MDVRDEPRHRAQAAVQAVADDRADDGGGGGGGRIIVRGAEADGLPREGEAVAVRADRDARAALGGVVEDPERLLRRRGRGVGQAARGREGAARRRGHRVTRARDRRARRERARRRERDEARGGETGAVRRGGRVVGRRDRNERRALGQARRHGDLADAPRMGGARAAASRRGVQQ